jgi:protein FAM50
MTDIKRVGDTGIHTVEGNIAGSRAAKLTKQREKEKAEYEAIKNKIKEQNSATIGRIDDKFNAASDVMEQEFRRRTVGLVSAEDFRRAREVAQETKNEHEKKQQELEKEVQEYKKKEKELKRKKMAATLSFGLDDDEEEEEAEEFAKPLKKLAKDPNVETSFLPDRERDLQLERERQRLKEEWLQEQEKIKNEVEYTMTHNKDTARLLMRDIDRHRNLFIGAL